MVWKVHSKNINDKYYFVGLSASWQLGKWRRMLLQPEMTNIGKLTIGYASEIV